MKKTLILGAAALLLSVSAQAQTIASYVCSYDIVSPNKVTTYYVQIMDLEGQISKVVMNGEDLHMTYEQDNEKVVLSHNRTGQVISIDKQSLAGTLTNPSSAQFDLTCEANVKVGR